MDTRLVAAGLVLLAAGVALDGLAVPFRDPLVLGLVVAGGTLVVSPLVGEV